MNSQRISALANDEPARRWRRRRITAAAAWLIRRTKQDETRERKGSIAYDTKDELFHAMRKDAISRGASPGRPAFSSTLLMRDAEDAVANMLMHKGTRQPINKK